MEILVKKNYSLCKVKHLFERMTKLTLNHHNKSPNKSPNKSANKSSQFLVNTPLKRRDSTQSKFEYSSVTYVNLTYVFSSFLVDTTLHKACVAFIYIYIYIYIPVTEEIKYYNHWLPEHFKKS